MTNEELWEKYGDRTWTREYTCAQFAQEILSQEYGHDIPLPKNAVQSTIVSGHYDDYIEALPSDIEPYPGNLCLMHEKGAVRGIRWHIGVVVNDRMVFHLSRHAGTSMITLASLPSRGFSIEGYYRCKD